MKPYKLKSLLLVHSLLAAMGCGGGTDVENTMGPNDEGSVVKEYMPSGETDETGTAEQAAIWGCTTYTASWSSCQSGSNILYFVYQYCGKNGRYAYNVEMITTCNLYGTGAYGVRFRCCYRTAW